MGKKRGSKKRSGSIDQAASTCAIQDLAAAAASISEDLSMQRHDEETALSAIYGDDFCLEAGAWNCPLYKIRIRRASEVTDHNHGGSNDHKSHRDDTNNKKMELTLQIQLNKKYPCSVPMIQLTNVVGVPTTRMTELLCLLQSKAKECADAGAVMGWELGQVVEEFLVDYSLKLEQENMQRELDLLGQYKKVDDANDVDSYLIGKCYEEELDANEYDNHSQSSPPSPERERLDVDIQKEMARQMQALDVAEKIRQRRRQERGVAGVPPSDPHADDGHGCDNDNDDDVFHDFADDYNQVDFELPPTTGSSTFSRYQTDFVELAPLGRGGGGEVVKAINRLDRRIYAIKRIVLESEDPDHEGEVAKKNQRAVIQNQKLRREVTTISRMTHKNIVRYYQAWVESKQEEIPVETTAANTNNALAKTIKEERIKSGSKGDESDSWDSSSFSSSSSSSTSSSSSSSNERMENLIRKPSQQTMDYARSLSLDNFLEHEMNDFSNPFLFHDRDHGEELNYPGVSSTAESDSDLLHSERGQSDSSRKTLYIQMEYCKTTMRDMIDESKLTLDMVWKFLRQILEALTYIHGEKIIHRDLKPANIFVAEGEEIKLGDFGLATTHRSASNEESDPMLENEAESLHDAIINANGIIGSHSLEHQLSTKSITGGVGTVFYVAPEQLNKTKHGDSSYGSKADIFSLGVLLFEMFNLRPFATYMERAMTLTTLRGDSKTLVDNQATKAIFSNDGSIIGDWEVAAHSRFPEGFCESVPASAQQLILWCLERNPNNRPTAKQILTSGLLPRKVELEQRYLDEVLQTLSDPQAEQSYRSILTKLFERPNPKHVLTTYDTDLAIRTNNNQDLASHLLTRSLAAIKGNSHSMNFTTSPMSAVSTAAAATAIRRSRNVVNVSGGGKEGEALRGVSQQVSSLLAMREATFVAVNGSYGSTLGSDPYMIDVVCSRLRSIFESHGATRLQPPFLRPRDHVDFNSLNGPAEVINDQGFVLTIREDLTVNFARAIARCGLAANNVKRYDIDKVFHESDAGGQPNESMEASFDIISDVHSARAFIQAEAILVLCRVMAILIPEERRTIEVPPIMLQSPIWFLRLSHTRLSEAIMDLLTVPRSKTMRQTCLSIFTSTTAPNPIDLFNERTQRHSVRHKKKQLREVKDNKVAFAIKAFKSVSEKEGLQQSIVDNFHAFISHGNSLPYPTDVHKALEMVLSASKRIYQSDINGSNKENNSSQRAFEEIVRSISQIKSFLNAVEGFGISLVTTKGKGAASKTNMNMNLSQPIYISLDLGFHRDDSHYKDITYQAILLQDNFFEEDKSRSYRGFSSRGVRIAEGGSYDEVVRHFRPPGNISTPIPSCIGVRFGVGKLLERIYQNASTHSDLTAAPGRHSHLDLIRRSLGYPFHHCSANVQVIVTGENGMDRATLCERANVASLLWSNNISCDYTAQSGLLMSLLKLLSEDNSLSAKTVCEWNVDTICGICAVLRIPFVVIVAPHLLSSKNVVKLRATILKSSTGEQYNYTGREDLIELSSLPSAISERLHSDEAGAQEINVPESNSSSDLQLLSNSRQNQSSIDVDCTYVATDQYYDDQHKIRDNAQWKNVKKVMKTSAQKMTNHLNNLYSPSICSGQSIPVIATDLPFNVVRDIGSCLMLNGLASLNTEIGNKYPEHKKVLRTLMYALDNQCQKSKAFARGNTDQDGSSTTLSIFIYSIPSDRYDLVTIK